MSTDRFLDSRCPCCGSPVSLSEWQEGKHPRAGDGKFASSQSAVGTSGSRARSTPAAGHAGVLTALSRLDAGERPALTAVRVAHTTVLRGNPQIATAWTDGDTVFVNDQSRAYKHAMKGDSVELAAALAHEQYHLAHGPDEAAAYAEQLRILRKLKASEALIREIEKAKETPRAKGMP